MLTSRQKAKQEIARLVQNFESGKAEYKNVAYNETTLRSDFLSPFLKALGWDVFNKVDAQ